MKFLFPERFIFLLSAILSLAAAKAGEPLVHVLVPGFKVQEIPVKLSNVNGLRFAPDGRLTALGYDGRIYLLSDSDGDGIEDKADLFWDRETIRVPVGMVWAPEGLYLSSQGKVSLLKDSNGDGKADEEAIIAQGWPATDVATGGTDAVGMARDEEGNIYFGLLVADYSNPYRIGQDGQPRYSTNEIRGTIQKWSPKTKRLETVCTGIRVPFALGFNRVGDLFNTDQEGETWCPEGNPLDEFNHIIPGRNYGFPPRHPVYLPHLVSEPPIVSFGPQHQSACGFVFNEPKSASHLSKGQRLFGPSWWEGDAFVAGESRGQIWRVKLVKTPTGYVGKEYTFARLNMLTTDVCISPRGELYVSCHSGLPDWGTGPKGEGKIFKISYVDPAAPQPVAVWAENSMEVNVVFDQPLHPSIADSAANARIEFGEFISTADRYENLKPPYQVVKFQETFARGKLGVTRIFGSRHLTLRTTPHPQSVRYALTLSGVRAEDAAQTETVDLSYDLGGLKAFWRSTNIVSSRGWDGWLPHVDFEVNRALLGTAPWEKFSEPGTLKMISRLKLPAGTNVLRFESSMPFQISLGNQRRSSEAKGALHLREVTIAAEDQLVPMEISIQTGALASNVKSSFHADFFSTQDPTIRPLPLSAFILPWAPEHQPPPQMDLVKTELAGGDFERGKSLFFGDKLKCGTCHKIRGEGKEIGPDLSNLASKDATSIWRDVKDPNATIHPDYVAFNVWQQDGEEATGFIRSHREEALTVLGVDGKEIIIPRNKVKEVRASAVSLMPTGLVDNLAENRIRDLLVFLTSEPPRRKREELEKILGPASGLAGQKSQIENRKSVVWVASKQDHGKDQHDYPAVQKMWIDLLNQTPELAAINAWEWPDQEQFTFAKSLVFYFWNHDWSEERLKQIDGFLERGGGIVVIHSGTIAAKNPEQLAERFGLASKSGGHTKYLHAPFDLKFVGRKVNPLLERLPKQLHLLDEPYWRLIGDTNKITVLATVEQEGKDWPQVWTFQKGRGRVFVSVPGHYTWTHQDPIFRLLLLRGLAWTMGEEPGKFETLAVSEDVK